MIKEMIDLLKFVQHHCVLFDYYYLKNELFVEWQERKCTNNNLLYGVYALDKKAKIIYKRDYTLNEVLDFDKSIWKSYLIIFSVNYFLQIIILIKLRELCNKTKCFGTIAIAQKGDILFFPKLNYQDVFLIKDIVSKLIDNENYYFAYAAKSNFLLV